MQALEFVFWDVAPCNVIASHQRFGGTYWLQPLYMRVKMEAGRLLE
jgi:hypothetical protein